MLKMFLKSITILLVLLAKYELSDCAPGQGACGDWTPFREDEDCIKVLDKKVTEQDAVKNCTELDISSNLVSIHSKEEQTLLNSLLKNYNNISEKAWIGLKYRAMNKGQSFEWLDGTAVEYSNWDEDAVKDGSLPCVQMSLGASSLGKWTDQSCKKLGLAVCVRKQTEVESKDLKTIVEKLLKTVKKQQQQINSLRAESVPIGFIYTQLPQQLEPVDLWPNTKWVEVTKKYAGLFFRAEGGSSETFGKIQHANFSTISNIEAWSSEMMGWRDDTKNGPLNFNLTQGKWTSIKPGGLLYWLKFYKTEVSDPRPKNTAVKIWKRFE